MRSVAKFIPIALGISLISFVFCDAILAQRGRGGGGGGGGGRSAGHQSPTASRGHSSPTMSRPPTKTAGGPGLGASGGAGAGANRTGSGGKGGSGAGPARPNTMDNRPNPGAANRPGGAQGLNVPPGSAGAKGPVGTGPGPSSFQRPGGNRLDAKPGIGAPGSPAVGRLPPGQNDRPRPSAGPSSAQLNDFLGHKGSDLPNRVDATPNRDLPRADENRPLTPAPENRPLAPRDNTRIDNNQIGSRNVEVGNVNIGNSVRFSDNSKAWIDNRHVTGNQVRLNAGDRYANDYRSGAYRRGVVDGYNYHSNWNAQGAYYGWRAPTTAAVGAYFGAAFASAKPMYYGYGSGGNVYYENNSVYVNGQPAGTSEQYAQQALDFVAAAPPAEQVQAEEWLPLGVFALSSESVTDSNAMVELAVNKQGVLAGTYYNESTSASRPLKGTVDQNSQRAVVGFADGKNEDLALEAGIYNLTQDEAPALLHHGKESSEPVLLVRLHEPSGDGK